MRRLHRSLRARSLMLVKARSFPPLHASRPLGGFEWHERLSCLSKLQDPPMTSMNSRLEFDWHGLARHTNALKFAKIFGR